MTRNVHLRFGSLKMWRPLAPFVVLFGLLMLFAVGGMLVIAHEADRSDAARAREAVARTFAAVMVRLASAAEMNAAAPPIASALSGRSATPESAYGYLNFTSPEALGYYGTVVLNHDGTAFAGTHLGLPWKGSALLRAARMVAPIAARLPPSGAATIQALVRDGRGQAVAIAVANIAAPAVEPRGDVGSEPLRRLAMISPVGVQLVPKILPSLGIEDFKMVAARLDGDAVAFPVENGAPLVFAWRSRTPGRAAIVRWAPAIFGMLTIALIALAFAGRANLEAIQALEQLAHHDSLTGLANRSAFLAELAHRQIRGDAIALGMIDLNGFKAVNDGHGHVVGDGLLQAVAVILARTAGVGDFVARLGGDEFAFISTSGSAANRLASDFCERIASPLAVGPLHLQTGAAIGIAVAQPGVTPSVLMAAADARLYEVKRASWRSRRCAPDPADNLTQTGTQSLGMRSPTRLTPDESCVIGQPANRAA